MVKNLNPSRMRFRLTFCKDGQLTGEVNPNTGEQEKGLKPLFTRWGGKWTLTQTQALSLAGANIRDAMVFFVRHTDKVTSDLVIQWNGQHYVIDSISYDDGIGPNGFDLITCHREVTKHG